MSRILLKYLHSQTMANNPEVCLLTVSDEHETRQMSIFCDTHMRCEIDLRANNRMFVETLGDSLAHPVKSLTSKLLPEVLCEMLHNLSETQPIAVISSLSQGHYVAVIEDANTGFAFQLRAADAVLLSLVDPKIPLYVESHLWQQQSIPLYKDSDRVAIPINAISREMLETSMDKAIENEDYETAQKLKEEIERRDGILEKPDNQTNE